MKLLLEGSLMALVLISEVVGLVARAKYRASTEAYLPAHRSFTIVSALGAMAISVGGVGRHLLRCVGGPEEG